MEIRCVWEHNGADTLLYSETLPGAYSRGKSREEALDKMPAEAAAYLRWAGWSGEEPLIPVIVQEKSSSLAIADADSDVLFRSERGALAREDYERLKALALRSAADFLTLYESVPDPDRSALAPRETFYGPLPRTAREMYEHTRGVNGYYFGEIGVEADHEGTILACRERGFALLEQTPDFLQNPVTVGSYDEEWSLRKVLRRFLWHDRIHAKALWRMAERTFGGGAVPDVFRFEG